MRDIQDIGFQSVKDDWGSLSRQRPRGMGALSRPHLAFTARRWEVALPEGRLRGWAPGSELLGRVPGVPQVHAGGRGRGSRCARGAGRGAERDLGWPGAPLSSAPGPEGRAPPPARPLSPPRPSLRPAVPPFLLLFLGEALLLQPGSMAAVETRVCETAGCSSEAKLQCPTCIKLGIQGSYFCSQVDARSPRSRRRRTPSPYLLRQPSRPVRTHSSSSPGGRAGRAPSAPR